MKTLGVDSILGVALIAVLSMAFSCSSDSDTPSAPSVSSSSEVSGVSSSSQASGESSSDAVREYGYCIYPEYGLCLAGANYDCPGGGILSETCPIQSSSSLGGNAETSSSGKSEPGSSSSVPLLSSSSSTPLGSSSSVPLLSSSSSVPLPSSSSMPLLSSSAAQELGYCVFAAEKICLQTQTTCPPSAAFSNACPYSSSSALPSSSSRPSSSSSLVPSSSSLTGTSGTFTDSRDSKSYKWVKIGTQTWMAENLNYNASGSVCYNNNTTNCTTYGRLYNWATARTACPSGWHLPSDAEWTTLTDFVGGHTTAGTKLKTKSGWNDYNGKSSNGTDAYGFAALPGGNGYSNDGFDGIGNDGYWWSSTEYDANYAYDRDMGYGEGVYYGSYYKGELFSVRCLQGASTPPSSSSQPSSSSIAPSSSSSIASTGNTFTDSRDGQSYKWVKIGTQTWMAQNLSYNANGSVCHNNNCTTYGRLYNGSTVMTVCPSGWHLPSDAEWATLENFVGGSATAGTKLKAKSGWNSNGTDDYGFAALPGGLGVIDIGTSNASLISVGSSGYWWSATEVNSDGLVIRSIYNEDVLSTNYHKTHWLSVRCLQGASTPPSSSSSLAPSSSSSLTGTSGTFTDSRDSKSYKWVKIGTQTWMAQNLNYNATGSKCYDNSEANCTTYGRLYDWSTAITACPSGWHLSNDAEWTTLENFVGGSATAGTKLKAKSGWHSNNGTDNYGFAALPGGEGGSNGYFNNVGDYGNWWSAAESDAYYAYYRYMRYYYENVYQSGTYKDGLCSVRCLQD